MNTDFVINMSSKADYFDSDRVLSKWGFTDSQCHCCGINNSDINGTYGKPGYIVCPLTKMTIQDCSCNAANVRRRIIAA